jgi:GGDEF domain-containing protein/putative methionine-R-sulfoxide reductase with GAF domain
VADKQTLLLDTMRALNSTLVLEDVLRLAARTAGQAMGVFAADIYVYSPANNTMTEVAYWALEMTPEDEAYAGTVISLDERPFYYPHLDDPVLFERHLDDPDYPEQEREIAARWGELSQLTVPLLFGGQLIGILGCVERRWDRRFTEDDKELFRLLSVPAALAIHNAQMFQHEEMRSTRLVNLLSAAQRVASALDREGVVGCVTQEVTRLFPTRRCTASVCLLETADDRSTDLSAADPETADGLLASALATRLPASSPAAAPPRLVVPLLSQNAPVGYVDVRDDSRAPFTRDEMEVVEILVTQAETALENARLYGELERQAITDGLTELYNQRYFYERLSQEVTRTKRMGTPFTLLMFDLDDFKLVNDQHGHKTGDEVLRGVARILSDEVRAGLDLAARYGGEEFVVILPDVGGEAKSLVLADRKTAGEPAVDDAVALAIAERIRRSLERAEFPAPEGGSPVRITLSGGVASFPRDAQDAGGLVFAADKALYLAKRLGKNRVESFK